jgi:hypothetical protein
LLFGGLAFAIVAHSSIRTFCELRGTAINAVSRQSDPWGGKILLACRHGLMASEVCALTRHADLSAEVREGASHHPALAERGTPVMITTAPSR